MIDNLMLELKDMDKIKEISSMLFKLQNNKRKKLMCEIKKVCTHRDYYVCMEKETVGGLEFYYKTCDTCGEMKGVLKEEYYSILQENGCTSAVKFTNNSNW